MRETNNKEEKQFWKDYDPSQFKKPSMAVDTAIFTILDSELHVLMIQRDEHPFKDQWSLVGGYIDIEKDHSLEDTAKRKLKEKTGVDTPYLEQVETVGNNTRDPREWTVSTSYFALLPSENIRLKSGKGASNIEWIKISSYQSIDLAFDHQYILTKCLERLKAKSLYTTLPINLMPESFTMSELQRIYEIILGKTIQQKSFRRRIKNSDILMETGEMKATGKRPAAFYKIKEEAQTHFFTRTIESLS